MAGAWVDSQGALFWRRLTLPPQEIINSSSRRNGISRAPPPSILDFHWLRHVQSQPVWVRVCNNTVMARNTVSLQYMFSLALTVCSPEFCNDLWTSSGRDVIPVPPWRTEQATVSCSLCVDQLCVLIAIYNKKMFLWWKRGNILHSP